MLNQSGDPVGNSLLKVRYCRESDLGRVIQIGDETEVDVWSYEDYKREIVNPDSIFLSALLNSKVVGFLLARLIYSDKCIEIYNIAVSRKYQQGNIGTRLLNYLIESVGNIDESRFDNIFLEVRESNSRAISFYEKNEFQPFGKRNNFYARPEESAILMKRNIYE